MKTSPEQLDALRELINIGIGRAAGVLNEMLSAHIQLYVPDVEILSAEESRERSTGWKMASRPRSTSVSTAHSMARPR
jgi:chemotaxis protein CheY-P-specific phosphatase CheC